MTAPGRAVAKRLNQGYSVRDLKALVDVKYGEWGHDNRRRYLRPSTLFHWNKNFTEYMAQAEGSRDDDNSAI